MGTNSNKKIKFKYGELFRKWHLEKINLHMAFADVEFSPTNDDKTAAWDMYVELITRITTQPLAPDTGDEETALNSIYSLFDTTRNILKEKGRQATAFTKIAVVVLNQVVRPFTAKWHRKKLKGAFNNPNECDNFREELSDIQIKLIDYSHLLAELAMVEDMTLLCKDDYQ